MRRPLCQAARKQREQKAQRHEDQVQQLQERRQANQTAIIKRNEITQLNKESARLIAEAGWRGHRLTPGHRI